MSYISLTARSMDHVSDEDPSVHSSLWGYDEHGNSLWSGHVPKDSTLQQANRSLEDCLTLRRVANIRQPARRIR